jgi:CelD/BcsL family acetyltransferase involved in cellulose biosynthesis
MNNAPFKIVHIRTLNEFEALHAQWNDLLAACENETVFLTWDWLTAWWQGHQGTKELWLITAWAGETLVGALPLMKSRIKRMGLAFRVLQTLGAPNTDESLILARGNNTAIYQSLCEYLHSQRALWDMLEIHEFRSEHPATGFIQQFFTNKRHTIRVRLNQHFFIPLAGTWDEYWKKLSKNLRHNIERRLRRIEENHKVTFEVIEGRDLNWSHFETIFEINKKGNYAEKYTTPEEQEIQRGLMERLRAQNHIRLMLLWLDEKAVAFDYGFSTAGNYEDWRTGFELAFAEWGTGTLMLYFQLKYLFSTNHHKLDFLRGEYNYKDKWLPAKREFTGLRIIPAHKFITRLAFIWIPDVRQWVKSKKEKPVPKE